METKIQKATIQKTTDCLSEIHYLLGENPHISSVKLAEICKRHLVGADIITYATRAKLIQPLEKRGHYKSLMVKVEPIHARRLLNVRAAWQKELAKKRAEKPTGFFGRIKNFIKYIFNYGKVK